MKHSAFFVKKKIKTEALLLNGGDLYEEDAVGGEGLCEGESAVLNGCCDAFGGENGAFLVFIFKE